MRKVVVFLVEIKNEQAPDFSATDDRKNSVDRWSTTSSPYGDEPQKMSRTVERAKPQQIGVVVTWTVSIFVKNSFSVRYTRQIRANTVWKKKFKIVVTDSRSYLE